MSTTTTTYVVPVESDERRRRAAWRPLAAAVIGGAVLVTTGFGAWASLTASASNEQHQSVTAGTLKLVMAANGNGVGATQAIANLAPGDVANRYVTLTNSGTLAAQNLRMAVTGTGAPALLADAASSGSTKGLRIAVDACSAPWNPATGACTATTPAVQLLAPTALSALGTAVTLHSNPVAVDGVQHLRLSASLPDQNENTLNGTLPTATVQGATAALAYLFTEDQRAVVTTNS